MTIATCLVLPEGVIFGADSTTSIEIGTGYHYLNHNQKIFEVGRESSLAVMTWGISSFQDLSHRTMIAWLGDKFAVTPPISVKEATEAFSQLVWDAYNDRFAKELAKIRELEAKPALGSGAGSRTADEDIEYKSLLQELKVGFCLGGHVPGDREPDAYFFIVDPTLRSPSIVQRVDLHEFWGQPSLFLRLYDGFDFNSRKAIFESEYWTGSANDLDEILQAAQLIPPHMTIRDGIDFVHFSVYATIKALKFSSNDQVCGGPIEIAVITSDRNFRWVRHKEWDSAIGTQVP
jgi:hypothetical protein